MIKKGAGIWIHVRLIEIINHLDLFFTFQPANDWSMAPPSEAEQNGAAVTPQLMDTTAKGQDDNRQSNSRLSYSSVLLDYLTVMSSGLSWPGNW